MKQNPCNKDDSLKKRDGRTLRIPRPSLSRELISMKKDGLIDFDRQTITIKDMEALEDILL